MGELDGFDESGPLFRKSSASGQGNCVEVAWAPGGILVRDSKNPGGGTLQFTPAEWRAFLAGVRQGEFDLERP
jgi:Domain of unknown function (DUF397)